MLVSRFRARFLALALLGALLTGCQSLPYAEPAPPPVAGEPEAAPMINLLPSASPTPAPSLALGRPTPLISALDAVTFMSYNVHNSDMKYTSAKFPGGDKAFQWNTSRGPAVVSYVKKANPDVIGFQEVKDQMKGLGGKPISTKMITLLENGLPDYTFVRMSTSSDVQPIAFKTSKFSLVDHGRIRIQSTGHGSDGNRYMSWAVLKDKKDQDFLVANIWPNDGNQAPWPAGRAAAFPGIINDLTQLSDNGTMPSVLLGDFNCPSNISTHPFQVPSQLLFKDGWTDSRFAPDNQTPLKNVSSWNGWGKPINGKLYPNFIRQTGYVIDYIWAKNATVLNYRIDVPDFTYKTVGGKQYAVAKGLVPSDHWPILSTIAFD